MTEFHLLSRDLTAWCAELVGLVWLVSAVVFAVRQPGSIRTKLWHYVRTLFPEPWAVILIPFLFLVGVLVPPRVWTELEWWHPAVAAVGLVTVLASTALMIWARWALGAMWAARPMVQEEHDLRTSGPYSLVRHPIYSGIVGIIVGATLTLGFGSMLPTLVCVVPFVAIRVWREERMMVATFGEQYRAYRARVPALVPFLRVRAS